MSTFSPDGLSTFERRWVRNALRTATLYAVATMSAVFFLTAAFYAVAHPGAGLVDAVLGTARTHAIIWIGLTALAPVALWDVWRWTHRTARSLAAARRAMEDLAAGGRPMARDLSHHGALAAVMRALTVLAAAMEAADVSEPTGSSGRGVPSPTRDAEAREVALVAATRVSGVAPPL